MITIMNIFVTFFKLKIHNVNADSLGNFSVIIADCKLGCVQFRKVISYSLAVQVAADYLQLDVKQSPVISGSFYIKNRFFYACNYRRLAKRTQHIG